MTTTDPVRIGIIGLGAWGTRAHLPAFSSLPGVEVVALVDVDEAAVHAAADTFDVRRVETDAGRLLRDPDVLDAVVIATPDDTHYDLVLAAFDAGLHVLCEKPLAFNMGQALEMVEAAERTACVARLGFLFRHSPVVAEMRRLVAAGFIGEVQLFEQIGINAQFADPARPLHWKMQRKHASGGVFVEYGAHTIDLALWFGGPLTKVVAHGSTLIPERPLPGGGMGTVEEDDVAAWIGEYASGSQALFRSGWASYPVGTSGMRVYGTQGSLLWEQQGRTAERLVAVTAENPGDRTLLEFEPPVDPVGAAGPFPIGIYYHYNRRLAESFIYDITSGEATAPTFDDGLAAQEVLAAIRISLDEERWVVC